MRAAWQLAISSLSARRLRTALLASAVALSAALIVAVACAMASVTATVERRVNSTVGAAEARIRDIGGERLQADLIGVVRSWPEVLVASPRAEGAAGRGAGSNLHPSRSRLGQRKSKAPPYFVTHCCSQFG